MSFILKPFKVVRNHWKKSIFFAALTAYGVNWARISYDDSLLRTAYCRRAQEFGDSRLPLSHRPRKILVFLNPVTHGGKAKKLFDKNIAPILHLAGLEVTLIKTEYEGQAKKYMNVVEDTDGIIICGGDGTLSEVVTGLLRRPDQDKVSNIPIGIVPLGKTNSVASKLFLKSKDSEVRFWLEACMAIVENKQRPIDVLHIKGGENKTVYALAGINHGLFRDTEAKVKKYWFFGPLKQRWAYLWNSIGTWMPTFHAKLQYRSPCGGCSKCYEPPPKPVWRWWHVLIPPKVHVPVKDFSQIHNPDCGIVHDVNLTTSEFLCHSPIIHGCQAEDHSAMNIHYLPETLSRLQFIKEGWARINQTHCQEITENVISTDKFVFVPEVVEESDSWFTIDSERFEVMPIEVELLRSKLNIFCGGKTPFVS